MSEREVAQQDDRDLVPLEGVEDRGQYHDEGLDNLLELGSPLVGMSLVQHSQVDQGIHLDSRLELVPLDMRRSVAFGVLGVWHDIWQLFSGLSPTFLVDL